MPRFDRHEWLDGSGKRVVNAEGHRPECGGAGIAMAARGSIRVGIGGGEERACVVSSIADKPPTRGRELQSNQYSGPLRPLVTGAVERPERHTRAARIHMKFRRFLLALLCVTAFAGRAAVAADDLADDLAEVTRLHHAGQTDAALQRADTYLAAHPRDPQMRFLEAVILAGAQRRSEAIAVLEKLTQDYP
ncbi:MAG: tetratricopeptide repeat protein, partial [Caldimonas sp.]